MTKNQKILKLFIKFLKVNQVYDDYLWKIKEHRGKLCAQKFIVIQVRGNPYELIINAFPWITPKEQKKTWVELHWEWVNLIKEKQKKKTI